MNTPTLLLCAALLSLSGCAAPSWRPSTPPPKPIACDAEALRACEPLEIEPEGAGLADTEEVDAINRHRMLRCVLRHAAAMACFCKLGEAAVLEHPRPADCRK